MVCQLHTFLFCWESLLSSLAISFSICSSIAMCVYIDCISVSATLDSSGRITVFISEIMLYITQNKVDIGFLKMPRNITIFQPDIHMKDLFAIFTLLFFIDAYCDIIEYAKWMFDYGHSIRASYSAASAATIASILFLLIPSCVRIPCPWKVQPDRWSVSV